MSARFAMRDCEGCGRQVLATAEGRCPHCNRALVAGADAAYSNVRLSPATEQPHVCAECGAPTHRLVRVRACGPRPPTETREKTEVPWIVHLVPGGVGCLASLVAGLGNLLADAFARRRPTLSLRVRQCPECGARGRPSGFSVDYGARRMSFQVHPRFAEALALRIRDAEREETLRSAPARGDDEARPVSPS